MTRDEFHQFFGTPGPVVLPVIHVLDTARTLGNIEILRAAGAPGCFLINHDFGVEPFLPIIREVRAAHPDLWIGINFLAVTGAGAFPRLGELARDGTRIDAYWADDARIDETGTDASEAGEIARIRGASGWQGLYFGGTAFKKQRPVPEARLGDAARQATRWMEVVTTSGQATGHAADPGKIAAFRAGIGDRPLAVASGITPENAIEYRDVDAFMVATGINLTDNFYDIDPARLAALIEVARTMGDAR